MNQQTSQEIEELETADFYRLYREMRRAQRAWNRAHSAQQLTDRGIPFVSKNDGAHLIVTAKNTPIIDFWPGTGLWKVHGQSTKQRGIYKLLALIDQNQLEGNP